MTNQKNRHVSPDSKWQVVIVGSTATWSKLTKPKYQYTIDALARSKHCNNTDQLSY